MSDERMSSLYQRRLYVQLTRAKVLGLLDVSVSRAQCCTPGCRRGAWRPGACYCRACWLRVNEQGCLPDERG
jgi:hypothetical protein